MRKARPWIGIPVDVKRVGDDPVHAVGEKYLAAVAHGAQAIPVLLPALGAGAELRSLEDEISVDDLLAGLDGLFAPGSESNVEPWRYGDSKAGVGEADPQRDSTALALMQSAIARDMPVLAVCRGFQELNVACGGTLHTEAHKQPGYMDHRCDHDTPREQRYALAHSVALTQNGCLAQLTGEQEIQVNSLHGQGIDRVGTGLAVDAVAPDGLTEAVVMPSRRFVVGVQWHPEWRFEDNPVSRALFSAFGDAARAFAGRTCAEPA